jgi:hypothetical protein
MTPDQRFQNVVSIVITKDKRGRWVPIADTFPKFPVAAPPWPARAAGEKRSIATHRKEPAFGKPLELKGEAPSWKRILGALQPLTPKGGFLLKGEWLKEPVPFRVEGRPAFEVMDEIARLAQKEWVKVGPIWVLAPPEKKPAAVTRS